MFLTPGSRIKQGSLLHFTKQTLLAWQKVQAQLNIGVREKLTAVRTYYVRTDGSDSNNGLTNTAAGAFLTIQKAWDVILTLDCAGNNVTVQIADGTYTAGASMTNSPVGGVVTFQGNNATPANVVISSTSSDCFFLGTACVVNIKDMKLQTTTSGNCIEITIKGAKVAYSNLNFGACAGAHMAANTGGAFECGASYTISGSATSHFAGSIDGLWNIFFATVTLTGTPAFSSGTILLLTGSLASMFSVTFSGAATGKRYDVQGNSVLQSFGAGTASTYFPGNANGTTATGGQQS